VVVTESLCLRFSIQQTRAISTSAVTRERRHTPINHVSACHTDTSVSLQCLCKLLIALGVLNGLRVSDGWCWSNALGQH